MKPPPLAAGEVHVWRFALDAAAGRAAMRALLAAYLGCDPCELPIAGRMGRKPCFEPGSGREWLRFNLSHAGGLTLVAVAREREVGVDVERISSARRILTIAQQLFSKREAASLRALPTARQAEAFFRLWARKEAYLKATGEGLGGLEGLDLSELAPGYALQDLDVGPGYAAALAVEGAAAAQRAQGIGSTGAKVVSIFTPAPLLA